MKTLRVSLLAFVLASRSFSAPLQLTKNTAPRSLVASEQVLVDGSRRAIIETGLSPEYFDAHFKVVTVIDKPADRRVVWRFFVNDYETLVTDSIGSYVEGARQILTHSVGSALGHTSEIKRTISRARALRLMKMCIGNFENPGVEYGQVDGYAQLFLVANHSRLQRNQVETRQRQPRDTATASGMDVIESGQEIDKRARIKLGSVNLQTGTCTRGAGLIAP